jgi:hypothetical protein
MSRHHHHDNKSPREEHPSGRAPYKMHHDWRFYAAGFFLLLALLAFIFSGNLAWRPVAAPPPPSGARL